MADHVDHSHSAGGGVIKTEACETTLNIMCIRI